MTRRLAAKAGGVARHVPRGLLLQWHITDRCNLRCEHCYQSDYAGDELPLDTLLEILGQYRDLLAYLRGSSDRGCRGHITVTGGEPFIRDDFLDLLAAFAEHRDEFVFAILTNGTMIDAGLARRLRQLRPAFVQVSVEGTPATHDRIRGEGNHECVVAGTQRLVENGVRTLISFTAQQDNFREFPAVAKLGRRLRVARVWADRYVPCKDGDNGNQPPSSPGQVLTPDETREFVKLVAGARRSAKWWPFGRTEIGAHRALQFLGTGGHPYACTAGDGLLALLPNGDLLPCRRMPICVGNVLKTPLLRLYEKNAVFRGLRDQGRLSAGCEQCEHALLCRGGLRCLSHAVTGDAFNADPGCWISRASNEVTK